MKIKENLNISTDDFWYDLTEDGHLKPEEILEYRDDVESVNIAIDILMDFKASCEAQIEDFIR